MTAAGATPSSWMVQSGQPAAAPRVLPGVILAVRRGTVFAVKTLCYDGPEYDE
jgi:hypothetical protein